MHRDLLYQRLQVVEKGVEPGGHGSQLNVGRAVNRRPSARFALWEIFCNISSSLAACRRCWWRRPLLSMRRGAMGRLHRAPATFQENKEHSSQNTAVMKPPPRYVSPEGITFPWGAAPATPQIYCQSLRLYLARIARRRPSSRIAAIPRESNAATAGDSGLAGEKAM